MFLPALILTLNLTFPLPQLGNCNSFSSCKIYCDIPWHRTVCTDFAIETGLVSKKVLAATNPPSRRVKITYPISELDDCNSKDECKTFCDIKENKSVCVNFARSYGIKRSVAKSEERAPAERPGPPTASPLSPTPAPAKTLAGLEFPIAELGNCTSKDECKSYCDKPENRQPCFDFAYKYGLEKQKKEAEKLSGLQFPIAELGNCGSLAECDVYCGQEDHMRVCNEFAKKHGFKPPANLAGPGGCTGAEECNAYCSEPAHRQECQAAWERICAPHPDWPECQRGPGGPGGCTSDEECRAYCESHPNDQDCKRGRDEWCQKNPDECKEHTGPGGCMSEEECRLYCTNNPDDEECRRGREQWCQEHPGECMEEARPGPGGCKSEEECQTYCTNNPDDAECRKGHEEWCQQNPEECPPAGGSKEESSQCGGMDCALFCKQNPNNEYCQRKNKEFCNEHPDQCGPPNGEAGPPTDTDSPNNEVAPSTGEKIVGPGGCKTQEECEKYCRLHPNECSPQQSPAKQEVAQ